MDRTEIKKRRTAIDLPTYMLQVIDELKKNKKYSAVHTYSCTLHSLLKFTGGNRNTLYASELFTQGRLKEYEKWMVQKELSWNSISTYLRTLRAVYNRLYKQGSRKYDPELFDHVYTKVESRTKRALTEQQISKWMYANADKLPKESKNIQAYFLLMFLFRGMPFIDLAHLRKKDLHGNQLIYCRHKTGKQMTVRIPKEALPLIKEYKDKNPYSIYLFPILDPRQTDDWLLYKGYQKALRKFNETLKVVAGRLIPGAKISSYTARHTWATLAFHMGMPVGIICEALGHSSIRVTETYLKPFENDKIDRANNRLISSVRKCKGEKSSLYSAL